MSTYNRFHPYIARLKDRFLLTGPTSTRETYHIVLDASHERLPFAVGDSLAVLPENAPETIERILEWMGATGEERVFDPKTKQETSFSAFLRTKANLAKSSSRFLSFLANRGTPYGHILEDQEALRHILATHEVQDLVRSAPKGSLQAQELVDHLLPLMPRFYSIASSPKVFPQEIHLTVAYVSYERQGELRTGVASSFLCKQALIESTPIATYMQPSNHFSLPDPAASIILIGPGTGIAPFRAFLQERLAQNAPGKNWLFFGERHRASDFYYESFFTELVKKKFLQLDTAFSRDQAEKEYVQHKMYKQAASLWTWLQEGAFLYVCGDAEKMAKDVDATLHRIAIEQGHLSETEANQYLKQLRATKRYLLDVY